MCARISLGEKRADSRNCDGNSCHEVNVEIGDANDNAMGAWFGKAISYCLFLGSLFSLFILMHYKILSEVLPHPVTNAIMITVGFIFLAFWLSGFWRRLVNSDALQEWSLAGKVFVWCFFNGILWLLFSGILLSFAIFLNCHLDTSKSIPYEVPVKRVFLGNHKAGSLPYAEIEKTEEFPFDSIPIHRTDYRKLQYKKGSLRIYVNSGLLGYKWISRIDVLDKKDLRR